MFWVYNKLPVGKIISVLLGVILGIPYLDVAHMTYAPYLQAPDAPQNYFHKKYFLVSDTRV